MSTHYLILLQKPKHNCHIIIKSYLQNATAIKLLMHQPVNAMNLFQLPSIPPLTTELLNNFFPTAN